DEPTHGLDPEARRSMLELIKALAAKKSLVVSSHNLADVDEVCDHVAIMSRGHLIFQGSLQDLKGRMRKNHFELDLEGDGKAIKAGAQAIANLTEVIKCSIRQKRLEVVLNDDPVNTTALANVFVTLSDNKVGVISIRTVGHQTEQAFLDLIGKEQATGFTGAFQPEAA
ncbi:MAG: ABC transporter ATP-binding protein, partial [Gemmataceae bacterium]